MDLIYSIIYNRYINYFLRWINKAFAPFLPSDFKIPPSGIIQLKSGSGNIKLATNQTSYLTQRLFWYGPSSFEYTTIFKELIKKIDCFYDIGANIGYYTLLACAENNEIKVYSFEPATGAYTYLKKNISLNNFDHRVVLEKFALTDSNQNMTFHEVINDKYRFTKHILSGESHASTKELSRETQSYEVSGITLDEYYSQVNSRPPGLIKIDTEGSEYNILKGGEEVISTHYPIIICEILYDFNEEKIESIMNQFDYEFYMFKENRLVKTDTLIRSADDGVRDCFFVHPDKVFMIEKFLH
jgi:FkbM family methyltransferase